MANQLNTLYPPQVATFIPAFATTVTVADSSVVKDGEATVPYTLSPYNESSKIKRVHVCVTDQKTNDNALNNSNGVYIADFAYSDDLGMYYVTIPTSAIKNGKWKINQFYKVQLRFDLNDSLPSVSGDINDVANTSTLGAYLISGRSGFSEWSSVCLVRPISEPTITLTGFDYLETELVPGFNKGIIPVSGRLTFDDSSETETLESFQVQVLDEEAETVLLDSGTIYTGGNFETNSMTYKMDVEGLDTDSSSKFVLRVLITTNNQYTTSKDYTFQILEYVEDEFFSPTVEAAVDNDDAIVSIHVQNDMSVYGTLYVKRACSRDDFKVWDEIWVGTVSGPVDITISDNTASSLTWYRYSVQLENAQGGLSQVFKSNKVIPEFYDAVFSRGSRQLSVRFNYSISSMSPQVSRVKVDTLGGKYPKFAENAAMNYKQFSISGLISTEEDENEKFLTKKDKFGVSYRTYSNYVDDKQVQWYNDYMWEREFREEVVAWLNDGEPKLYRSQTEGNMCVMITDVSITPNSSLARRIWNFSATVYEVEDGYSLPELDYLGIYDIHTSTMDGGDGTAHGGSCADSSGTANPIQYRDVEKVAQNYQVTVTNNYDFVSNVIEPALQLEYTGVLEGRLPSNVYLKNLRIYFHNKPHIYLQTADGNLQRVTQSIFDANPEKKDQFVFGYRFEINRKSRPGSSTEYIFVNSGGFYAVPDEVEVTDISFPDIDDGVATDYHTYEDSSRDEKVTLDYTLVYRERNDTSSGVVASMSVERSIIGQISGTFEPEEYVADKASKKYSFSKPLEYYRKMSTWKGVSVDVTPYAVMSLKFSDDTEYGEYMIGQTGVFNIMPKFNVSDLCFLGVAMVKKPLSRAPYLNEHEFVDPDISMNTTAEVESPLNNGVYTINGQRMIFYKNAWHDFELDGSGNGIAKVPVEGSVNYLCDVLYATLKGGE